ncbi:hypothetical protein CCHL11_06152 [Colletotrichum chlorophyti]|uniref:Uncharacterized protein n=1 Tax=Colletotrichum chlorophyti TaxID=708187 RepID=A0A1Q8RTK7_9PEZI|nr:hypothetical protein CCHL11_06152 [Colletotrichum chlorophyti]
MPALQVEAAMAARDAINIIARQSIRTGSGGRARRGARAISGGIIAAIVIASVVFIAAILLCCILLRRHSNQRRRREQEMQKYYGDNRSSIGTNPGNNNGPPGYNSGTTQGYNYGQGYQPGQGYGYAHTSQPGEYGYSAQNGVTPAAPAHTANHVYTSK